MSTKELIESINGAAGMLAVIPNTTETKHLFNVMITDEGQVYSDNYVIIGWKLGGTGGYIPVCAECSDLGRNEISCSNEDYICCSWLIEKQFDGSYKMRGFDAKDCADESECIEVAKRLAACHFKKVNA